jgi:hypothetical protein
MSVGSDFPPVEDDSSAESTPDTFRAKIELIVAMGTLAIGLDVSQLSDQELEALRINDMLYLVAQENIRRILAVVGFLRSLRGNHNLVPLDGARKARGGRFGKLLNNRTCLTTDEEYVV